VNGTNNDWCLSAPVFGYISCIEHTGTVIIVMDSITYKRSGICTR